MAIVVANSVFAQGNSTSPSATLSVTGADRCLFVCLKTFGDPTVSSPQVDGQPLTEIIADTLLGVYTYLYVAPNTGSRTAEMTLDAVGEWGLLVANLTGVHQSSPIGTPLQATNTEGASISQAVTGVANGLVLDFAAMIIDAITVAAGQTRYPTSAPNGDSYFGGFVSIGMSAKSGTGSVTMQWDTAGTFGDNTLIAVPFLPSGGGGGGSLSNQNLILLGVG